MNKKLLKLGFLHRLILVVFLWVQIDLACAEPVKPWLQLTPIQQEALLPLSAQWDSLPPKLQNHLLLSAKQYPELTPIKKKRYLSKLEKWSKLTPEQRERARQKYIAIHQLSIEKREQFKQTAIEKEKIKTAREINTQSVAQSILADSASPPVSTSEH